MRCMPHTDTSTHTHPTGNIVSYIAMLLKDKEQNGGAQRNVHQRVSEVIVVHQLQANHMIYRVGF